MAYNNDIELVRLLKEEGTYKVDAEGILTNRVSGMSLDPRHPVKFMEEVQDELCRRENVSPENEQPLKGGTKKFWDCWQATSYAVNAITDRSSSRWSKGFSQDQANALKNYLEKVPTGNIQVSAEKLWSYVCSSLSSVPDNRREQVHVEVQHIAGQLSVEKAMRNPEVESLKDKTIEAAFYVGAFPTQNWEPKLQAIFEKLCEVSGANIGLGGETSSASRANLALAIARKCDGDNRYNTYMLAPKEVAVLKEKLLKMAAQGSNPGLSSKLAAKMNELRQYAIEHVTGKGMHKGIAWLRDSFNEYFSMISSPSAKTSKETDIAHRQLLSQRVAIECISKLNNEQLEKLDTVLDDIAKNLPMQRGIKV